MVQRSKGNADLRLIHEAWRSEDPQVFGGTTLPLLTSASDGVLSFVSESPYAGETAPVAHWMVGRMVSKLQSIEKCVAPTQN
jgi:hypothetical protein